MHEHGSQGADKTLKSHTSVMSDLGMSDVECFIMVVVHQAC